jgi:hypothetical protein
VEHLVSDGLVPRFYCPVLKTIIFYLIFYDYEKDVFEVSRSPDYNDGCTHGKRRNLHWHVRRNPTRMQLFTQYRRQHADHHGQWSDGGEL